MAVPSGWISRLLTCSKHDLSAKHTVVSLSGRLLRHLYTVSLTIALHSPSSRIFRRRRMSTSAQFSLSCWCVSLWSCWFIPRYKTTIHSGTRSHAWSSKREQWVAMILYLQIAWIVGGQCGWSSGLSCVADITNRLAVFELDLTRNGVPRNLPERSWPCSVRCEGHSLNDE